MKFTGLPIERRRGDTWPIVVTMEDENGLPVPVAGSTATLIVDPSQYPVNGDTKLFELTGSISGTNKYEFPVPEPAANAPAGENWYEVKMTAANGNKITTTSARYIIL